METDTVCAGLYIAAYLPKVRLIGTTVAGAALTTWKRSRQLVAQMRKNLRMQTAADDAARNVIQTEPLEHANNRVDGDEELIANHTVDEPPANPLDPPDPENSRFYYCTSTVHGGQQ